MVSFLAFYSDDLSSNLTGYFYLYEKTKINKKSPGLAQKSLIWKDKAYELLFFRGSSYIIDFKCDFWITVQDCPTQPSDTPHLGLGGLILILT